ncbi:hypothetical protein [Pseudomonas kitaguniensis]|uniref:hypothetical protein n=1 Tax=Pseudomonas kitaguniensis TaxID=2607908 RepID=UPI003CC61E1A
MEKTIRLANPADINAIFDIRTSVQENHLSHDQLTDMGITPETIRQAILDTPCAWVAEVDGVPVGFPWLMLRMVVCSLLSFFLSSRGTDWGAA